MFQTIFIAEMKIHFLFDLSPPPEDPATCDKLDQYGRAIHTTDDDIKRLRKDGIYVPDNQGKNTHTRLLWYLIVSPLQQWLRERAAVLRYAYLACFSVISYVYSSSACLF